MTAGVRLGQRLLNSRDTDDMLLVWPDAFHVRPDRLLQGLDAVLGQVPVVGGAASARSSGDKPMLFCGDECCSGAVSGLRLGGKFRHAIGVTQGCRPLGEPLRVTRAHENLILELDGRPALDVLRERAPAGLLDDLTWAFNFLFVGLLPEPDEAAPASGEYLVRNIISADPDTGVLGVADRVGEGQHIVFAHREARAAEADLRRMLEGVSRERTGLEYRFGLYFNCLARGRSLYEAEGVDTALLQQALPGVPLLGFFCNAEIGPLRGLNQLFTYTGVLLLIAE
jgi:small ligand-binding sensory domain FIST